MIARLARTQPRLDIRLQLPRALLRVGFAAGRQKNDMGLYLLLTLDGLAAQVDGLGLQDHAVAAAVRVIVHLFLLAHRVIADIVAVHFNAALAPRAA